MPLGMQECIVPLIGILVFCDCRRLANLLLLQEHNSPYWFSWYVANSTRAAGAVAGPGFGRIRGYPFSPSAKASPPWPGPWPKSGTRFAPTQKVTYPGIWINYGNGAPVATGGNWNHMNKHKKTHVHEHGFVFINDCVCEHSPDCLYLFGYLAICS